jgi:hypothetical protein
MSLADELKKQELIYNKKKEKASAEMSRMGGRLVNFEAYKQWYREEIITVLFFYVLFFIIGFVYARWLI